MAFLVDLILRLECIQIDTPTGLGVKTDANNHLCGVRSKSSEWVSQSQSVLLAKSKSWKLGGSNFNTPPETLKFQDVCICLALMV